MSNEIKVLHVEPETRYSRLELAGWSAQRLQEACIMVAGAGALGNEVIKNLVLIGVGTILVVDFDTIEVTNLSRSVLFRPGDEGRSKAQVAAERARAINPAVDVSWLHGDLMWELGTGVYRRMDLVLGCLDNRAARLAINRQCWLAGTPWIEGALNGLDGQVQLFGPAQTPCYECQLTEQDYALIAERFSCQGVPDARFSEDGTVPTTTTGAALIAALQVQEAMRCLHDQPMNFGTATVYTSVPPTLYRLSLSPKEDCLSHEHADPLVELAEGRASELSLGDVLAAAQRQLGHADAALRLDRAIVTSLFCWDCISLEEWVGPAYKLEPERVVCPACGKLREVHTESHIDRSSRLLDLRLSEAGIPPGHIIRARYGDAYCYFELSGDFPAALTPNQVM